MSVPAGPQKLLEQGVERVRITVILFFGLHSLLKGVLLMVGDVATAMSQVLPVSFLALGADALQERTNSPWG